MKSFLLSFLFLITLTLPSRHGFSQSDDSPSSNPQLATDGGNFQLGLRTTFSLFGPNGYVGEGVGGQFRLQLWDRINTEWFADYITTNLGDLGRRQDAHIGWSVMFYPWIPTSGFVKPYILAGHCFDYTSVNAFSSYYQDNSQETANRWSSAAQAGIGSHFFLSKRAELSFNAQYMIHFGNDIHTREVTQGDISVLQIDNTTEHSGFEGHLLVTLGLHIKLADLW